MNKITKTIIGTILVITSYESIATPFCSRDGESLTTDMQAITKEKGLYIITCKLAGTDKPYKQKTVIEEFNNDAIILYSKDEITVSYFADIPNKDNIENLGPRKGKYNTSCEYRIIHRLQCKKKTESFKCVDNKWASNHCIAVNDLPCSFAFGAVYDKKCP